MSLHDSKQVFMNPIHPVAQPHWQMQPEANPHKPFVVVYDNTTITRSNDLSPCMNMKPSSNEQLFSIRGAWVVE